MEDDLWWKMTLTEDDISWKTTFDGRQPLMKDHLWWRKTISGRQPLTKDNLWWKTTFDGRGPLSEDDRWWKTTFDGRRPSIGLHYITWKKYFDSSLWQPQQNWHQTWNPIRCLNLKYNFTWWKKCTGHCACTHVQKRQKGQARVKIIIANPAVISSNPPEFRDK